MTDVAESLRAAAAESEDLHTRSRRVLVAAIRSASASGLTQREIADAVGRSQPEVSRLLRFQPRSALGRAVRAQRRAIEDAVRSAGGADVRIFGSVSRGDDGPGSDVDLLVDFATTPSLFALARLEQRLAELVGVDVDVTPSSRLRPYLADAVLAEATPL